MIISNSMVAIGLAYRNLNMSFKNRRSELSSVSISVILATYMAYKDFFNERKQLKI